MEGIRTEEVPSCALCGARGQAFYVGLHDLLCGTPGTWGFSRCSGCGLVWLNPRPAPEDLGKVYAGDYYTHQGVLNPLRIRPWRPKLRNAVLATSFGYKQCNPGRSWRWAGRLASLFPPIKERVRRRVRYLDWVPQGKLLEVGSGTGSYLALMRELGWEVQGVEPDPEAARVAQRQYGVPVFVGRLEEAKLRENSFDAITMSHVLEHVYDPVGLLRECLRLLRPGGKLVAFVPNGESVGHKVFGRHWLGLDPPRHLYVFDADTLRQCARRANLRVQTLRSTVLQSRLIWQESEMLQQRDGFPARGMLRWAALVKGFAQTPWRAAGEELLLIGSKGGNG